MKLLFFALFCLGTFSGAALEINSDFVIVSSRTAIAPEKKVRSFSAVISTEFSEKSFSFLRKINMTALPRPSMWA